MKWYEYLWIGFAWFMIVDIVVGDILYLHGLKIPFIEVIIFNLILIYLLYNRFGA